MTEKYILAKPNSDIYNDPLNIFRTPVLTVINNKIVKPEEIDLNGLKIQEWLKQNPNKLKYKVTLNILSGKEICYEYRNYYNPDWELIKIPLDDNEIFTIVEEPLPINYFSDIRQLEILIDKVNQTFNYNEPDETHKDVYSLFYREIILLSSMEVEIHWKSFLKRNGYREGRTTTIDYVKLNKFINFNIEISLNFHPNYSSLKPFLNWDIQSPTKSLDWYNAYNKIKHNRTEHFKLATLNNALLSVSALIIVMILRYGNSTIKNHLKNNPFKLPKYVNPSKFGMEVNRTEIIKYFEQ